MHDPHHPANPSHPAHGPLPHAPLPGQHGMPSHGAANHGMPHTVAGSAVPKMSHQKLDSLDPIELIDEPDAGTQDASQRKIKAFGSETVRHDQVWKRPTVANGTGAVRVKSFHGKYSDQGMEYLDRAINDWLDAHPEAEVKFVTSTVGVFEGKIREPALVLNVWY